MAKSSFDAKRYAGVRIIGGGCSCERAPNCGHFDEAQSLGAMRSSTAAKKQAAKAKSGEDKAAKATKMARRHS